MAKNNGNGEKGSTPSPQGKIIHLKQPLSARKSNHPVHITGRDKGTKGWGRNK